MAYQSEIEFRVRVIDKELRELEKRIEDAFNPFGASGGKSSKAIKDAADRQLRESLRVEKEILDYVKQAITDEERLREAKAKNTAALKKRLLDQQKADNLKAVRDIAKAEETLARQNARLKEDLALGVGFPLLFGGGVGAVAGGALGALAGGGQGGFGLQILFSALGQQVDDFFNNVKKSASSVAATLDGTSASLEAVREAGIVVEDATISYIKELEESGRAVEAYTEVQEELIDIYGIDGVNALKELKEANEFANTETGKLAAVLQTELSPVFITIAELAGVAAQGLRELTPAIADAVGEFLLLGFLGGSTTAQIQAFDRVEGFGTKVQGIDPAKVEAGVKDRDVELETQAKTDEIIEQNDSLERQLKILELGNDLLNKDVVLLKEIEIISKNAEKIDQLRNALQKEGLSQTEKDSLQQQLNNEILTKNLGLAELNRDVEKAQAKDAEKKTKEAEKLSKEIQKQTDKKNKQIANLKIDNALSKEILDITQGIADAALVQDETTQLVLEKKLAQKEAEAAIEKIRAQNLDQEVEALKIEEVRLGLKQQLQDMDNQQKADKALKIQEAADEIKRLEDEIELESAATQELRNQLVLEQALAQLREDYKGADPEQLATLESLTRQLFNLQNLGPIDQFVKDGTEALMDMQTVAVTVSQGIGDAFGSAMTTGLNEILAGTKSAEEVFADLLNNIANTLFQVAAQMIATYIAIGIARSFAGVPAEDTGGALDNLDEVAKYAGTIPGFADGGRPPVGQPSIVGERGPELFVPSTSGTIIPNDELGGGSTNVVVNVDASGSSASGDSGKGKELGSALGAAIQAELIKQKRPGGLLS